MTMRPWPWHQGGDPVDQSDLVEVAHPLKQVLCVKG
jgi:hypothetical protein